MGVIVLAIIGLTFILNAESKPEVKEMRAKEAQEKACKLDPKSEACISTPAPASVTIK